MDIVEILKTLSSSYGLSSFEDNVIKKAEELVAPYTDAISRDKAGNLTAYKKGTEGKNKVLIATHIDEVGLMVSGIEKNGLLRFSTVGGIDLRILPGMEVMVIGKKNIPGVIGSIPPHFQSEKDRGKAYGRDDLYIDTGLDTSKLKQMIDIGTPIVYRARFSELKNKKFASKSLDNRASCAAMIYAMYELTKLNHKWDVYGVFTLQEECTMLGGKTAGFNTDPDLAIVMDATFGLQPGVSKDEGFDIDSVLTIARGPNLHPEATKDLMHVAEEEHIKYEIEVAAGMSGTDATGIQISRKGIPTVLISLPIRNMHTSSETININSVINAGKLTARYIASLDENYENRFE
ncbi:MAG: M20/M25/M40 family metallo-hydrolase [Proteobacteria bacterium]|nr:M20/M25/M40 family metallo-hydrolase [Pseudomonadota bacterium]